MVSVILFLDLVMREEGVRRFELRLLNCNVDVGSFHAFVCRAVSPISMFLAKPLLFIGPSHFGFRKLISRIPTQFMHDLCSFNTRCLFFLREHVVESRQPPSIILRSC